MEIESGSGELPALPERSVVQFGHAGYLTAVQDPQRLRRAVEVVAAALASFECDAVACRGLSGAAIAYPLSLVTGKPVLNVRKETEDCHGYPVEGPARSYGVSRYAIVDDLIESGNTVREIIQKLEARGLAAEACVGIVLYHENQYGSHFVYDDAVGKTRVRIPILSAGGWR